MHAQLYLSIYKTNPILDNKEFLDNGCFRCLAYKRHYQPDRIVFLLYEYEKKGKGLEKAHAGWLKVGRNPVAGNIMLGMLPGDSWKKTSGCGSPHLDPDVSFRIIGGSQVMRFYYPWMVHLSMGCGGTLITER